MKKKPLILILLLLNAFLISYIRFPTSIPKITTDFLPQTSQEDTVIVGVMEGPPDLDPMDAWDRASWAVQDQVCEGLFGYNLSTPNMDIIPRLALDYGVWGTNGLGQPTYTVDIRTDVWFHDGTKFDATAVRWNFDRLAYLMDNDLAKAAELFEFYDPYYGTFLPIINKTTIIDGDTVEFTLNTPEPYGPFEVLLGFNSAYMLSPISTPAYTPINTTSGDLVGTGPFIYDGYTPGIEVNYHSYANYMDGIANFTYLKFKVINDQTNRNNALLNKDIDILNEPAISMLDTFSADPDIVLEINGQTTKISYLGMNNYWINSTFRKAISYAINYSYIQKEIYNNQVVRIRSPIPEGITYANGGYNYATMNITKARMYMQSMGFGVGLDATYGGTNEAEWSSSTFASFNYTYNTGNIERMNISTLLVDNLDKIGIDIVVEDLSWPEFVFRIYELAGLHRDMTQLYSFEWNPDYNDPSNYINYAFTNRTISSNGVKYNGYLSAKEGGRDPMALIDNVQLLMEQALFTPNGPVRESYYNRIQELLIEEDMPWAYGFADINSVAYNSRITGYQENTFEKMWLYDVKVLFEIDRTEPIITINSPINGTLFRYDSPNFDITIDEENLDSTWYCLNNGIAWSENVLFTDLTGKIDQALWNALGNGSVLIRFYANDSSGRLGFSDSLVFKDILPPNININSPNDDEIFHHTAPIFDLAITEGNPDSIWYTLDGGSTNYTTGGLTGSIDQTLWNSISNGSITIRFYANDSLGNIGFSEVLVYKDSSSPTITINLPLGDDVFGYSSPNYDLTVIEGNLDSIWYTLDGGGTNYTSLGTSGSIDQTLWDSYGHESITIRFYANDSLGNTGFADVLVYKDITTPVIVINNPIVDDVYGHSPPIFDLKITESNLDSIWYTVDNGLTNVSCSDDGQINTIYWDMLASGSLSIKFYANDTVGNLGFSEISIDKDITTPVITIILPELESTYVDSVPIYSLEVDDLNLDSIWYTLDDGVTNIIITELIGTIDETEWNKLSNGQITIRFYANDTLGNIGSALTIVIKNYPQTPPGIPGAHPFALVTIFSAGVMALLYKTKKKQLKKE